MAKFTWKSLSEEYLIKLERLGKKTDKVAEKALYVGAKIVADEIRKNMGDIPIQNGGVKKGEVREGVPTLQVLGLQRSFGISPMQKEKGEYNVKLGFDGNNQIKTKKYPDGQPNAVVAATIEKGTSYQTRHPFLAPAVRKTKKKAEEAMQKVIDEEAAKIMK